MNTQNEKQVLLLDQKTCSTIKKYLPDEQTLDRLVAFFSIFSDQNRLRIVSVLAITQMCVNDIAAILQMNQTTVSHQLKILKMAGAVKSERQGKIIFYSIASETVKDVMLNGVEYIEPKGVI